MKKVIVVGGGFAGIKAVRELAGAKNIQVTLISNKSEFRYSPALYRTATGRRRRESFIPLSTLVDNMPNVEFKQTTIDHIDRAAQTLTANDGKVIHYDYCVLALGVVTSYFNIPGLEEYSYSIKSAEELTKLKQHLHQALIDEQAMDKNYVIVGGGPTGVELAAELGHYLKRIAKAHKVRRSKVTIELIEAAPKLLPTLNPRASRIAKSRLKRLGVRVMLNKHVGAETKSSLKVDDRSIPTKTVVWTAGVSNSPFYADNANQFEFDEKKRVKVNNCLQVDGAVFIAGDNAAVKYGGLALTAVHTARAIGKNIKRLARNRRPIIYRPLRPISAIPLGHNKAIVQYGPITFDGVIGGFVRRLGDLVGYADIMGYPAAIRLWLKKEAYEESCPVCRMPEHIKEPA